MEEAVGCFTLVTQLRERLCQSLDLVQLTLLFLERTLWEHNDTFWLIDRKIHNCYENWDWFIQIRGFLDLDVVCWVENCDCFDGNHSQRRDGLYVQYYGHVYHIPVSKEEEEKIRMSLIESRVIEPSLDVIFPLRK
jgi:hypothetical protein